MWKPNYIWLGFFIFYQISMIGTELDFSFLCCLDVVFYFEKGDPNPIVINVKLLDD